MGMQEIWKEIEGYEGLYEVSNLGRVRSLDREQFQIGNGGSYFKRIYKGRILKFKIDYHGYYRVHLSVNGERKHYLVHRLVAEAFIPNPNNLPCVNHKDEDKTNNSVDNLEWCDVAYNNAYNGLHSRRGRNFNN